MDPPAYARAPTHPAQTYSSSQNEGSEYGGDAKTESANGTAAPDDAGAAGQTPKGRVLVPATPPSVDSPTKQGHQPASPINPLMYTTPPPGARAHGQFRFPVGQLAANEGEQGAPPNPSQDTAPSWLSQIMAEGAAPSPTPTIRMSEQNSAIMPYAVEGAHPPEPASEPVPAETATSRRNKRQRVSPDLPDDSPCAGQSAMTAPARLKNRGAKTEQYFLRTVLPPRYDITPHLSDKALLKLARYVRALDAAEREAAAAATQPQATDAPQMTTQSDYGLAYTAGTNAQQPPPGQYLNDAARAALPGERGVHCPSGQNALAAPALPHANAAMEVDPLPPATAPQPTMGYWTNGPPAALLLEYEPEQTTRRGRRPPPMASFITGDERAEDLRVSTMLFVTPSPKPNGFPLQHLCNPFDLRNRLNPDDIAIWDNEPVGTKFVIQPFAQPPLDTPEKVQAQGRKLRGALSRIVLENDFYLFEPREETLQAEGYRAGAWLTTGWSTDAVRVLATGGGGVWSTEVGSLQVTETIVKVLDFLLAYEDFDNVAQSPVSKEEIEACLRQPRIKQTICDLLRDLQSPLTEDETKAYVEIVMNNFKVAIVDFGPKTPGKPGKTVANVYCSPPTTDPILWQKWRAAISNVPLVTRNHGTPKVRRETRCTGCYGADHPPHKCPFMAVEQWCHREPLPNDETPAIPAPTPAPTQPRAGAPPPRDDAMRAPQPEQPAASTAGTSRRAAQDGAESRDGERRGDSTHATRRDQYREQDRAPTYQPHAQYNAQAHPGNNGHYAYGPQSHIPYPYPVPPPYFQPHYLAPPPGYGYAPHGDAYADQQGYAGRGRGGGGGGRGRRGGPPGAPRGQNGS
ncbi:uncharacterized protein TRAVEDRAFT_42375 [Trametes versicolor FP-101664 SS1]|uniref:uncharacterized protein n=1 Tax=Trametes versicolor (strain FP-101664) TaxID=717944 RepID=UPI0004622DD4|nr:uncharacterized protein TRAVEDRAFT_42375 [Trametes versicolor FP-101664 SS1]EIW64973.1 hypothetical protein TRAVEDRAFT_42375 [Trametes versicolor FP-101664 SS1]